MRQLHVLGVTDDGDALLLGPGATAGKASHRVRLDDRLRAAVRGQLAKPGGEQHRAEIALTPKEIQARLRAGETPEEVAKAAQVPVARLMPYAAPVEAERQRIVDDARAAHLHRSRGPAGSRPLGETVDAHLAAVTGLKVESIDWSARRRRDGAWIVSLTYAARGGRRAASWLWRPLERDLTALDIAATRLSADETPSVRRTASARPAPAAAASSAPARKRSSARPAKKKASSTRKATTGRKAATKKAAGTSTARAATRKAPSKAASASKAATARKAAAAKKAVTTRKAAARKAAAAGKAATTRTAASARKAATAKPPATKATPRATKAAKATPTRTAATRATATRATATRAAAGRSTASTRKPAAQTRRAAPAARKPAVRKPTVRKPAARKATPGAAPNTPFRPTLVETPPALTPVAPIVEPIAEPVPVAPVAEPVAAPAAEARPAETRPNVVVVPPPAAPRKPGQRVPVPSWDDVLLGVQPHRDEPKG